MSFEKVPNSFGNFFNAEITVEEHRIFRFRSFVLDAAERQLCRGDETVPMSPKVFDTLVYLAARAGHLVTKEELMNAIWPDSFVDEGNIPKTIYTLRKTLGEEEENKFIETVPTKGYRFIAEVTALDNLPSVSSTGYENTVNQFSAVRQSDRDSPTASEYLSFEQASPRTSESRLNFKWIGISVTAVIFLIVSTSSFQSLSHFEKLSDAENVQIAPIPILYWEMDEPTKLAFVRERSSQVQRFIGDDVVQLDDESLNAIQSQVEWYVSRRDNLSQEPFQEGLRSIFGRASQYVPLIAKEYEMRGDPPAIGIYQAMVESEYRDCLVNQTGNIGIFQFTRRTARKYKLTADDMCRVDRQAAAASKYISNLLSDFGTDKSSWTLALLSYDNGAERSREQLRELRSAGISERTYWAIFRNRGNLKTRLLESSQIYVPRFFAAAIIGESPESFGLVTPPLLTLK